MVYINYFYKLPNKNYHPESAKAVRNKIIVSNTHWERERERLTRAITNARVFQAACSGELKQPSLLDSQILDSFTTIVSLLNHETQALRVTVPHSLHRCATLLRWRFRFPCCEVQALSHTRQLLATLFCHTCSTNLTNQTTQQHKK